MQTRSGESCKGMYGSGGTEGTGKPAFKDMPFAVAGKTGTAHVADGNIKYDDWCVPGNIRWIFSC